jgi:hypothetical protein
MASTPNTADNAELVCTMPPPPAGKTSRRPMPCLSPHDRVSPFSVWDDSHDMSLASLSPPPQEYENRTDTDEDESAERARREEEESLALARALQAEEAMAVSYAMSVDYLRHNRNEFSEEDLAALQAAMAEDEEEEEAVEEDTEDGLSYELLLRLGERIGDVKSERWARVAREKIDSLATYTYDPKTTIGKDEHDCGVKCLVCQFAYEKNECLRKLPCGHSFHTECVDQWLMTKDCCPYCRQAIVEEE